MGDERKERLLSACVSFLLLACFVAGAAGDVPDGFVYTDLHKTVQKGNEIVLHCEFYGAPIAVYWKRGDDPDSGTNLIMWVDGEQISGSCVNNKACHMTDDNSLVIEDARIADQGRYICRVSNYLGILIHNFTDVNIYAPPNEPYPIIDECTTKEVPMGTQICSIPTNNTMNITCSASRFFPDLNLFFLHESNKITNIGSNVRENEDGTKNKSIMIKASASEIHYVCVASDIPGLKDERTATLFITSPTVPTPRTPDMPPLPFQTTAANPSTTAKASGTSPAKIVVPMVILVIIALVGITFVLWKRHQRRGPPEKRNVGEEIPMLEEVKVEGTSKHTEVEDTMSLVQNMKVEGVVSFYELWLLAYNTPKEDMGKVCAALIKLGIIGMEGQKRREQMYDALCDWKKTAKTLRQAQMLRDALEEVDLGARWLQIYDKIRQATPKISEGTMEQILLGLERPEKVSNFLCKLIRDVEIEADNEAEKNSVVSDTEGKNGDVIDTEIDPYNGEEKEDINLKAIQKFRQWNKGPLNQNPFVLVSLALERAGSAHVSKTFFEGTVSFYELRSLLYDLDTPIMEKVRRTLRELGIQEEEEGCLGPQQLYDALCDWKEKHNRADQAKVLRDALERADFEEAWLKILEQRKRSSGVTDGTLKQILLDIKDPDKIQKFLSKLVPGSARNLKTTAKTNVIQQAMETLREWNKGPFDENPIVLLSCALERARCHPVDRTFFYGTLSNFELWTMVHGNLEVGLEILDLRQVLLGLGIHINDTTTQEQLYLLLCNWKDEHRICDQLLVLKILLIEGGLHNIWQDLHDRRNGTDRIISEDTLEHILWHLKDHSKINSFLQKLSHNHLASGLDDTKPVEHNVRVALTELKEWMKSPFDKHPVVILSLALEGAECSPEVKTFFRVPSHLQKPIQLQEIESLVRKLTSRHCQRLANEMPNIDEKRISDISDENNNMLFDTKSLIYDWIVNDECSNYEKRCKLDDALITIGRHDMTDNFGTIDFRRRINDLSTNLHPMSKQFSHDTIFDDDLIRLKTLMDFLDLDMMSKFCKKVGFPDQVKGKKMQSPSFEQLWQWRNSNLDSKPKEVFSELTELIGDTTCLKHVTDEELEHLTSLVKDDDKKDKLLSALKIDVDKKRWKWKMNTSRASKKEKTQVSDGPDGKQNANEDSTSKKKQGEETSNVHDEKDEQVGLTLVDLLKGWRGKHGDTSCRKTLRAALKSIGMEECIINKTPRKYMYKAELVRVAFNILMRDVYPVIEALGIDQKKVREYKRQVTGVDKGSVGLLQQICQGKNKSEAYHRRNFCLVLAQLGYVDVARSTYVDYEQSACELSRIAFCLEKAKFQSLIDHLGLSPDELTQCQGTDGEVDGLEAMRVWKNLIRPVHYPYRLHIVYSLQAIDCRGLADEVLKGHYRQAAAEDDVIRDICSRLDDSHIKDLCGLLKLEPDGDRMISITAVVNWVNKWMQKYDPHPKAVKTSDRFHQRKRINNELFEARFYELAHEIMILEYSIF